MAKKIKYNTIEKWFIENGWKVDIHEETKTPETARKETVYERRIVFRKWDGDYVKTRTHARYEHVYRKVTDRWGCNEQSNWYSFYCYGKNNFKIENNICFRQLKVEQIEAALKVVGMK